MELQTLLTNEVYGLLLVFCRVGACMMLLPVFGSSYVPPRVRLVLSMAITIAMMPVITGTPAIPANALSMAGQVVSEVIIGAMIGMVAKILSTAIHIAGTIMSMQSSLAQASLFDPNQATQSTVLGVFLEMVVLVLIFSSGVHHVLIKAIASSYQIFPPVSAIPLADFSELTLKAVSKAFLIGFQLSMPLIIIGTLVNLASGLLARLMPSFQVYFVIMPAQILVALFVFMTTFSAGLLWYMEVFGDAMNNLFR